MAENSAGKQRGAPFQKGKSGNPNGKPKGTRHRITVLAEKLMQDDARDIVRAVLVAARSGDMTAARLILESVIVRGSQEERLANLSLVWLSRWQINCGGIARDCVRSCARNRPT